MFGLAAARLAQLPRSPAKCVFPKEIYKLLPEAFIFFFDLGAINYWDEEQARLYKEAMEKQKFEQEHKSDSPMGFDSYQAMLKEIRKNEDTEED
jgi:hypothetical protein